MASQDQSGLPYVPLAPYNGTGAAGGDSLTTNLNMWYQSGDITFIILATALVLLMVPGVGFFYSGLARRKSALSLLTLPLLSLAITSLQWFLLGYSLTFSPSSTSPFLGNLDHALFTNTLAAPTPANPRIPDLLFAVYQGMFACVTVALATGAVAERGRMLPCVVFMFVWATLVYDPIACWTWNPRGWSNRMGGLDFAGGTPVHIASGAAGLAYSMMLGKRRGHGTQELNYRPHNVGYVVVGTVFLWLGWFGFNAGSAGAGNLRAVMAAVVTNLAAGVGGVTWCLLDWRLEKKWSTVGFCSGVVAGLVAITPGSGFVPAWAALPTAFLGAAFANYGTKLKFLLRIDDALDIFAVHGIGGLVGNICTAFFAADYIARLDGVTEIKGGWLSHNWVQLPIQLADSFTGGCYSFVLTCLILFVMNLIPGLQLRVKEESEIVGIDDAEIGEFAYDYVELTREVNNDMSAGETASMFSEHHSQYPALAREKTRVPVVDFRTYGMGSSSS
jgi:Amt family ammonium transporter